MYLRVGDDSSLDAAKPVKEGLSDQAWQGILQRCSAGPVRPRLCTMPGVCTLPECAHCLDCAPWWLMGTM